MPRKRKSGDGALYYDENRKLWIARFDNGYNANGTRKQVKVTSRSQTEARRKMEKKRAEIALNQGAPFGNQTVNEWASYWLENIQKPKMKPAPFRSYRSQLTTWILPVIGKMKIKDVRPSDLRRIYDNIKKAGRATATEAKAHIIISSMFEAARLEGITPVNTASNIKPPKVVKQTKRGTFEPDETLRILEAAKGFRHSTKWLTSLYSGLRQGERRGATIDSLDFRRGLFTVQWNMVDLNYEHGCDGKCGKRAAGWCPDKRLVIPQGIPCEVLYGRVALVPPKSGESRTFPLPPSLMTELERHVAELTLHPNPHGLLWPAANGNPMREADDQAEWRALLVAAGVDKPEATTHWARHTAISDLGAAGVADRTIGGMVGQKTPETTSIYSHLSTLDAIEAMSKLSERRNPS